MVLDHRRPWAALPLDGRRILLVAVTAVVLAGGPALAYIVVGVPIGLSGLVLLAAVPLGLIVPPHRLVAALAPAWLLAPMSAEVLAAAFGVTCALMVALVLRFATGALRVGRSTLWLSLFAAVLIVSLLYPATSGLMRVFPGHDLLGILVGLAVAAGVVAAVPDPSVVVKTIAAAGAAMAGLVLAGGALASGRLVGAGLNANYLGVMLALPCIAALGLAWHARQPLWILVAAPSIAALVQTRSRGALVAVGAGICYLALWNRSWRRRAFTVATAALVSAVYGNTLIKLLMEGRSAPELDANNAIREAALRLAVEVAVEHPLRGIGYGMFPSYAVTAPQVGTFINTHNEYVRLACEAGAPAAALFCVLLVLAVWGRCDANEAVLRAVVVVYATGLLFGNLLSNMFISMPFWLALGCLLARAGTAQRIDPVTPMQEQHTISRQSAPGARRQGVLS